MSLSSEQDSRDFVRIDGRADVAAGDAYAASHRPGGNCTGQRDNEFRIIISLLQLAVAEISDFITGCA
jgi:hypothetical protein